MVRELAYLKLFGVSGFASRALTCVYGVVLNVGSPTSSCAGLVGDVFFEEFNQNPCLDVKEADQCKQICCLGGFLRHKPDTLKYSVVACRGAN